MVNHIQFVMDQRKYHHDYKTSVKSLTNRQLLKQERQECQELADIDECEREQRPQPSGRKYYLGNDLHVTKKYAIKNHIVTAEELKARGYVCVNGKYVKRPFSLSVFNNQIAKHKLELVKGIGYFWWYSADDTVGLKLASMYSTSIYVCHFNHLSKELWEEELTSILKELEKIELPAISIN